MLTHASSLKQSGGSLLEQRTSKQNHEAILPYAPSWKRLQGENSVAHPVSTGLLTKIRNSIFTLKDEKSVLDVKPMSWEGSFCFFVFPVLFLAMLVSLRHSLNFAH